MAMTDLCRACVEAECPRARESLQTQGGQPGTDAVLAKWWGRSWGSPGDCREIASVETARLLQLQVQIAGLGQAAVCKQVYRASPGLPSPVQVGTVGCGASALEECKLATCISLGVQGPRNPAAQLPCNPTFLEPALATDTIVLVPEVCPWREKT